MRGHNGRAGPPWEVRPFCVQFPQLVWVYDVLVARVPRVEPYSIDEMFLDLDLPGDLAAFCSGLRREVRQALVEPYLWNVCPLKLVRSISCRFMFIMLRCDAAKHFDRDPETNEVLWFGAPPVDIPHPPGPQYSLAYLSYLAKRRKSRNEEEEAMDVDVEDSNSSRRRRQVLTVTEQLETLIKQHDV